MCIHTAQVFPHPLYQQICPLRSPFFWGNVWSPLRYTQRGGWLHAGTSGLPHPGMTVSSLPTLPAPIPTPGLLLSFTASLAFPEASTAKCAAHLTQHSALQVCPAAAGTAEFRPRDTHHLHLLLG